MKLTVIVVVNIRIVTTNCYNCKVLNWKLLLFCQLPMNNLSIRCRREGQNMLEWIAILTMLIDHIGYTFFPNEYLWRIIGRVAFPLYCFLMIIGLERTKNKKRYLKRLLLIACISQIPVYLLFDTPNLNVVFTLLLAATIIYRYECCKTKKKYLILLAGIVAAGLASTYMEYGLYGISLCFCYYFLKNSPMMIILIHTLLNFLHSTLLNGSIFDLQFYSLVGSFVILTCKFLPNIHIQRNFYRSFYPLHLFILVFVQKIFE